jgi:ubiquinone/menaquinone biosynthesis C-methylase UbiE
MKYLLRSFDYLQPDIANAWDDLSLWSAPFGLMLLREMPLIKSGMVVDIGCGTGFPLMPLSQRLGPEVKVVGLDVWQAGVERAHAKAVAFKTPNVELHLGSASEIPLDDEDYDLVVSNLGINNFEDPETAFAEAWRVLKPKGRMCITTNVSGTFSAFYEVMLEVIAETGDAEKMHELTQHIAHRKSVGQVEDLFKEAGFVVERTVEDVHVMRYATGSAFLHDYLIVLGFLPAWKDIVGQERRESVFKAIEAKLNAISDAEGEFRVEVPMLYVQGLKPDDF